MTEAPARSLAEILVQLVHAREAEMARVARILHDDVGQVLSAVGLQLDVMRLDFKDHAPELSERAAEVQKLLERAIGQVREISFDLNPATVERAGLQFALDRLVGRYRQNFNGVLRLMYDTSVRVPTSQAVAMFQIADRAIDNALRHAGATHVEILVRHAHDGVSLEVSDNGAGFDLAQARARSGGLGLLFMDFYARQAGLDIAVDSGAERGTIVKIYSPAERPGDLAALEASS